MFIKKLNRLYIIILGSKVKLLLGSVVGAIFLASIGAGISHVSNHQAVPAYPAEAIKFQVEKIAPNVSGEDFFVNYRLKRENVRQERKAMLLELLNSTVEETKHQAQKNWLELSTKIQKEDEIENLLKIKGFKDAVADVFPDNVTVIVYASGLTPNELMMIQNVVVNVTNISENKITISTKQ